jgi:tetratricopeptide (TPR) repeat protein
MNRRSLFLATAALVFLTSIAYLPALRNGFIWDDEDHFTQNLAITGPQGLQRIWSTLSVSRYYPLTLTTFWVQRRLWGLNPLPYHAVNIILQGINTALLFVLLRMLNVRAAWAAAALWAVHPVNAESVAWATELKNIQSGTFFYLSLLCFLRFECSSAYLSIEKPAAWGSKLLQTNSGCACRLYALSLLCFAASLLSKPSTVVLPLVLLLLTWWQNGCVRRTDIVRAIPFFFLSLAMSAVTIIEQRWEVGRAPQDWSLTVTQRLILAGQAFWFYLGKVIWPLDLTFVYPRWTLNADSLLSLLPLYGVFVAGMVLWQCRKQSWAHASAFGLGYFLIALLPVLGFFDIFYFRYSFVADHLQYLASVGVVVLLVAGVGRLLRGRGSQIAATTAALAASSTLTWQHLPAFCDNETLWRDTLTKDPRCWLAHNNLGNVFWRQGKINDALEHYEQALRINPNYAEAHHNLGNVFWRQGRISDALEHYEQAVRIDPNFAEAQYSLGVTLAQTSKIGEAIDHLEQAVRIKPNYAEAHYNLAIALRLTDRMPEAIGHLQRALQIKPDFTQAQNALARMQAGQ